MIELRVADESDARDIAGIYEPIVRDTAISFETDAPSPEEMARRIAATRPRFPWLVATRNGSVIGYAFADAHRDRSAYRWSVNVTIYVAQSAHRSGVGSRLYRALIAILKVQGFRSAFAGIALPNPGSVALHESVGFEPLGVYEDVGFKLGAWRSVGWWRLGLAEGDDAPAEPVPFAKLRDTPTIAAILG